MSWSPPGFAGGPLRYYNTAHGRPPTPAHARRIRRIFRISRQDVSSLRGVPHPPHEPPPELSPEEIQQRLDELFADMASQPELPKPPPEPPPKLTPEEIQQQLDEAFAGIVLNGGTQRTLPEPRVESPRAFPPEEIQQQLDEAFAPWERRKSHPSPGPSPRRFRSSGPAIPRPAGRRVVSAATPESRTYSKSAREASRFPAVSFAEAGRWRMGGAGCMAGLRRVRGPRRARRGSSPRWSRGGASGSSGDGPKKKKFPAGRKRGERWITEPMREHARAEAHRLKGGRFTLDRALTLALLQSANGCLESTARAKAMLDAQECAAMARDRQAALARIAELRASLLANS